MSSLQLTGFSDVFAITLLFLRLKEETSSYLSDFPILDIYIIIFFQTTELNENML